MPEITEKRKKTKPNKNYNYSKEEKKLFKIRAKRFERMYDKKKDLGIDDKCDRMDALYTPHLTGLEESNVEIQTSEEYLEDKLFLSKARKSMPIAFEKVSTAQALLIKQNPKVTAKASREIYKDLNDFVIHIYYNNFSIQNKKVVWRKYIYHLSKYGIAYEREYVKKTYKKKHIDMLDEEGNIVLDEKGNPKTDTVWEYDVFDEVAENLHPKLVILDDNCYSVKDVNKPANDLIIQKYLTEDEFDSEYPDEKFENAQFVKEGQGWMLNVDENIDEHKADTEGTQKIQALIYENRYEDVRETWINGIPMESVPLPGGELSVNGDKWAEDIDNYDGIGIGQIIELYLPIVDDILNSSLERLRQIVRPREDRFNNITQTDEMDDVDFGAGDHRTWNGNPADVVYNTPPVRSAQEAQEMKEVKDELDNATGITKELAGISEADTAFQSAQNRESALRRLSLPLDSITKTMEDAANISLPLFDIVYSEPLQTDILSPADDDFDEALAIVKRAMELGIEDERAVVMEEDDKGDILKVARRRFREEELPLTREVEEATEKDENGIEVKVLKPTGRIVESDEKEFWELIPKHFNWKGHMQVLGQSFLPTSKAIEDERVKETTEFLLNVPIRDELGQPTLVDANGQAFTIDKVRLIKDRAALNPNIDPEKYVVPLDAQNQNVGNINTENPLESPDKISAKELTGKTRPELKQPTLQ